MPRVVWTGSPIYLDKGGERFWAYGAYVKNSDTVLLKKYWADEEVVRHEFMHACGDSLGEDAAAFSDRSMYGKVLEVQAR
jgi:hypothetical protein